MKLVIVGMILAVAIATGAFFLGYRQGERVSEKVESHAKELKTDHDEILGETKKNTEKLTEIGNDVKVLLKIATTVPAIEADVKTRK